MRGKESKALLYKEVRRILAVHSILTDNVSVSVSSSNVELSGDLLHRTGAELSTGQVSALVKDLSRKFIVTSSLSNWELAGGSIYKKDSDGNLWEPEE